MFLLQQRRLTHKLQHFSRESCKAWKDQVLFSFVIGHKLFLLIIYAPYFTRSLTAFLALASGQLLRCSKLPAMAVFKILLLRTYVHYAHYAQHNHGVIIQSKTSARRGPLQSLQHLLLFTYLATEVGRWYYAPTVNSRVRKIKQ